MSECCIITDADSGDILTSGRIIARKSVNPKFHDLDLVSTDGKWYFNAESDLFRIEYADDAPQIPFTKCDEYIWHKWMDWDSDEPYDLYRDYGLDELDDEVQALVMELNRWPGIETLGSCSGHGKGELWVDLQCTNLDSMDTILNVLRTPYHFPRMVDRFRISLSSEHLFAMEHSDIFKHPRGQLRLTLCTNDIGEPAYESAEMFARYLRELREIGYPRRNE